jgi:hypothetical protein
MIQELVPGIMTGIKQLPALLIRIIKKQFDDRKPEQ